VRYFIYGGSGSGKSAFAERLVSGFPEPNERCYIATMCPEGDEARLRIARHRAARADRGFTTIERYTALAELPLPDRPIVLLECLGNLVANEMFSPGGAGKDARRAVLTGLASLHRRAEHFILVSNDVGSDGVIYDGATRAYQEVMAAINAESAAASDVFVEMVCGIPLYRRAGSTRGGVRAPRLISLAPRGDC
jgi:adenosylcobinamide kinase/adenosylcobinamide-phosphate guanylyltransferase